MKITNFRSLLDTEPSEESRSVAPLTGRELQELISPLSCKEFANSYFSRLSLYVEGYPDKFSHIYDWEGLKQALTRGRDIEDKRFNITASFASGEESGSRRPMFEADLGQVGELLDTGATICITNIHMADPRLARWAQAIRGQLNFTGTVGVNCYVSPDGSGLPMHYDKRIATTLQIAGKKRWKFSTTPAQPWPDYNATYQDGRVESAGADYGKRPDEMEFREVELSPGDLLCLPAGTWHAARGVGFSLALNLYFAPRNIVDRLLPLLQNFAVSNEHWRGGPPATVEKVQGEMPSAVSAYMRERLDEFQKFSLEMMERPDALGAFWLSSLTESPYTGWQPEPVASLPRATSEDRFRVAGAPLRFIETRDKAIVPCDHGLVTFPPALAPILRLLASETGNFSVPEVLSWQQEPRGPSPKEIVSLLQMLYKVGILEMV